MRRREHIIPSGHGPRTAAARRRRFVVLAAVLLPLALVTAETGAARVGADPEARSPFHPEQCEMAIAHGRRRVAASDTPSARLTVAEGFLCAGLAGDDPWALEEAIALLRDIVAASPDHLFARLELADALRARYPLSEEALGQYEDAKRLLEPPACGAACGELAEHIDASVRALGRKRERLGRAGEPRRPPAETRRFAAHVTALAQSGIEGERRALELLDDRARLSADRYLDTLQRAELLRGTRPREEIRGLYEAARHQLCRAENEGENREWCSLVQFRIEQLDRVSATRWAEEEVCP
jgi:hypothetical protein